MIDTLSAFPFFKIHATQLPVWLSAAKSTLLVQPSFAAAERVFSLLNSSFKSQQDLSL